MPLKLNIDWADVSNRLNAEGHADLGRVLSPEETQNVADGYDNDQNFRSHIKMRRHGFGEGEYKYYCYPLPSEIQTLRDEIFPGLASIANDWNAKLGIENRFPATHQEFIDVCHRQGQTRPTPLLLRYRTGDYNCLHQDLYGDIWFPFQVVILLSNPEHYTGGEFIITEQRPRMQSKAEVVPLLQGHAIAFAVNERPKQGSRGYYRVKQRHGVSAVRSGSRSTLGIIFHDAK